LSRRPRAAWFALASGAPTRIGYDVTGRAWIYTHVVRRTADEAPRHAVANQWDLLTPLGIDPPDPVIDALEMPEEAAARTACRSA
jgi:ADP-heptose:LPS heptosyltransferase